MRFVSPILDLVFKTLWIKGDTDVRAYLERIVEHSIGHKIGEYTLGPQELGKLSYKDIANRVDVLLQNDDVRFRINVEMNGPKEGIEAINKTYNKSEVYIGHMLESYYSNLSKEERYKDDIKIEQVNLNCFYALQGKTIHRLDYESIDRNFGIIRESVKTHHIYLPRMQDLCYDEREESLDIYKDYSILLCQSYEEMEKLAEGNKEREALVNFLKKLGSDREFMSFIDQEEFREIIAKTELEEAKTKAMEEGHEKGHAEGLKKGHAEGLKEGIQEGSLNAKKNIILKMNSIGFSINDIVNSVELSEDEVLNIIKNNDKEGN